MDGDGQLVKWAPVAMDQGGRCYCSNASNTQACKHTPHCVLSAFCHISHISHTNKSWMGTCHSFIDFPTKTDLFYVVQRQ